MTAETKGNPRTDTAGLGWAFRLSIAALPALGFVLLVNSIAFQCGPCGDIYIGLGIPVLLALPIGVLGSIIAAILVMRASAQRKDRLALALSSLLTVAAVVCSVYLSIVWTTKAGTAVTFNSEGTGPGPLLITGWSVVIVWLALPAAILAYKLLRRWPSSQKITLGAALATVVALTTISATAEAFQPTVATVIVPIMVVSRASAPAVNCAKGVYPSLTISNAGGATLDWSIGTASAPSAITISDIIVWPPGGTLAAGQK